MEIICTNIIDLDRPEPHIIHLCYHQGDLLLLLRELTPLSFITSFFSAVRNLTKS